MAYSFRRTKPELAGVIIKERVRCGKSNCCCIKAKRLHGWYHYLYWRDGRKLRKRYIPRAGVNRLKQDIKSAKAKDLQEKLNLKTFVGLFKQLSSREKEELFNEPLNP